MAEAFGYDIPKLLVSGWENCSCFTSHIRPHYCYCPMFSVAPKDGLRATFWGIFVSGILGKFLGKWTFSLKVQVKMLK